MGYYFSDQIRSYMNPFDKFKEEIAEQLQTAAKLKKEDILSMLESPPEGIEADLAFPCFALAKKEKKSPVEIALSISKTIRPAGLIRSAEAKGPYANFHANWGKLGQLILEDVLRQKEKYGAENIGNGRTVVVEYSGVNSAKPMSVGHLRSTIIGRAIYNIYSFLGYRCISDEHLGDWGTQFGKLIYAYKTWGDKKKIEKEPIKELLELYVRFHQEAEKDKALEDKGREEFRKLEKGDKENTAIWKKFDAWTRQEADRIYKLLGVDFDCKLGESFYLKEALALIREAQKKKIAKESQGAIIIDLAKYNLPPLLLQKSDESTLYATRDLATLKYRKEKFKYHKNIYCVGSEQSLYFQQVFAAAELLGISRREENAHVDFGLVTLPEGKMSTREGRVIFLEEFIGEAVARAEKIIDEKNPKLQGKKRTARMVGIGAIKYADLSRDRVKSIVFEWDRMISFEGDTGPYIQYTYARAGSILQKAKGVPQAFEAAYLTNPKETRLLKKLAEFPFHVKNAARDYKPHYVANYAFDLASAFNEFYQSQPVLKTEEDLRAARLVLVAAVQVALKNALGLLGIDAPEEM